MRNRLKTDINLPLVLSFESEDHVKDFMDAAVEIIPKLKYQRIYGDNFNCVLYTRRDAKYRAITIESKEAKASTISNLAGEVSVKTFAAPITHTVDADVGWGVSSSAAAYANYTKWAVTAGTVTTYKNSNIIDED